MIYAYLRVWANWVIRIFFRKVYTQGIENVPKKKALLIASNHPNGFAEPITMACLFPRPLHFLVRGDVFENPVANWFLEQVHCIPIFRFKDGFENLRKNNASIEFTLKKLKQGETILIFVEGGTKAKKTVRPLQKGLARIAFQVLAMDDSLDLDVLPVGLNYFDNSRFRSESILSVGKPLSANQYFEEYKDDHNKGIRQLTADVFEGIKENVIALDDLDDTALLDQILLLKKAVNKNKAVPIVEQRDILPNEKSIATLINNIKADKKSELKSASKNIIDKYGLVALRNRYHNTPMWLNVFWLIALFVPAVTGVVVCAFPFFVSKLISDKTAKKSIFYLSIWLSATAGLTIIYYFIIVVVACIIYGWLGLLLLLGPPFFYLAMIWRDRWQELRAQLSLGSKSKNMNAEIYDFLQSNNLG